jgi:DNA-binding winged helix-turn-helix (wHTH) protein
VKSAIRFGAFELRPADRLLLQGGQELAIGGRAFDVLCVLVLRQPHVVSMAELLEAVWPRTAVEPNNVQVQIWALRKLLGARAIATVPRRGYRFMPDRVGNTPAPATATPFHLPLPAGQHRDWPGLLASRRLLTLVARQPVRLTGWMAVIARGIADHRGGLIWTLDAVASPSAATTLARRLRSRADVVVLAPDARRSDHLRATVDTLLDQAPAVCCIAAATAALGHPDEVARHWEADPAEAPPVTEAAGPSLLRARPRPG